MKERLSPRLLVAHESQSGSSRCKYSNKVDAHLITRVQPDGRQMVR